MVVHVTKGHIIRIYLSHPNDCVSRVDGYKNKICVLLVVIVACTKSAAPAPWAAFGPLADFMMSSPHGMAHGTDRATARDTHGWTVSSKMAIVSTKSPSAGSSSSSSSTESSPWQQRVGPGNNDSRLAC